MVKKRKKKEQYWFVPVSWTASGIISNGEISIRPCSVHQETTETSKASEFCRPFQKIAQPTPFITNQNHEKLRIRP